ncbi:MAG TPA: RsmE family RNA methyltransferase, partial [Thermoanaerobaculia bacterium]|nr:RsmE family RNA methyltransferase [Thermoanaerobaculia bacterium]
AVAAVEQCGRACLPKLSGPHPLAALPGLAQEAEERIFLDPGATQLAPPRPAMGSLAVAIGPEGGWSQAERQQLRAQGFAPAGLGERTLRLETAALAAACLCLLGR